MRVPPDDTNDLDAEAQRPSKSERKRAAHAAQDLGEALIGLREAELEALELPERLRDAVREARRITSRAAGARQRQYIGKLMRDVDPEPIRAALAARNEQAAQDAQRFKRVEAWRDRLLNEGPAALEALYQWFPDIDRAEWLRRITAAATERERTGRSGPASRELFRALRLLLDRATMPR